MSAPPPDARYVPVSTGKETNDKLHETKLKIADVQETIRGNMESAMNRGEQLTILESKSADLSESSNVFQKKSKRLLCQQRWNAMRPVLIGLLLLLILILILYFALR